MNIYTVEFNGYYPVGAVALVVAEDIDTALILINNKLKLMGFRSVEKTDLKQQDNSTRRVDILLDGNY
jgi:hypothetical protein